MLETYGVFCNLHCMCYSGLELMEALRYYETKEVINQKLI